MFFIELDTPRLDFIECFVMLFIAIVHDLFFYDFMMSKIYFKMSRMCVFFFCKSSCPIHAGQPAGPRANRSTGQAVCSQPALPSLGLKETQYFSIL